MAVPNETLWDIEPHTIAKHTLLRRYLGAWFPILNRWHDRIVYVDGFCGPGEYLGGEPGSPIIAIDVAIHHRGNLDGRVEFFFLDKKQERIDHLKKKMLSKSIPSHFKIHIDCNEFKTRVNELVSVLERNSVNPSPTFLFVDPFGFSGFPFSIISRFLRIRRCEALITFMVDSINRFLNHPNEEIRRQIEDAFGTSEAREIAESGTNRRIYSLKQLYQHQLESVANHVRHFEMRDRNNRVIYFLFFATNHKLGLKKMKEAMWSADPSGVFSFSDRTDPDQTVLFEQKPSLDTLKYLLRQKFIHKNWYKCEDIRSYIELHTPYLKKHLVQALKEEENIGRIEVKPLKQDGKKRRAGTYPDNVTLRFI